MIYFNEILDLSCWFYFPRKIFSIVHLYLSWMFRVQFIRHVLREEGRRANYVYIGENLS